MKIGIHIISFFLAILILSNSLRASLTYSYYKLDPLSFIEALCENKDQPELQCNGKCQLRKVAQSQDSSKKSPENIIDFKELILFTSPGKDYKLLLKFSHKQKPVNSYQNLYSYLNIIDWFHPPQV
ncbi:hypothetical protein [Winogradskyella sp.]|jgi:hypothetical protein|uniref:hypothetical protein n=1 Tax=Winogradskyella sp. TaxID=1883156 RepID=UPI0025DE716D|nr:hypothetical protein [Winogradskyella sp.]MCT4630648.1 hypothetical protein [Winogradskyella sp.]